jgi:hypothetical protein
VPPNQHLEITQKPGTQLMMNLNFIKEKAISQEHLPEENPFNLAMLLFFYQEKIEEEESLF